MRAYNLQRHKHEAGMSLAEVLVATAIFAVIFIAALLIYDRSNRVFQTGVQSADLQQNTRIAFDKMVSDLRMTGFDYDRDGVPSASNQFQQPDEQIEYAGPSAITIRANFDYNDDATEGGRVTALENTAFPVVTTGNDEIVTYALVSEDPSKNTDTITFYADVTDGANAARQSFQGGSQEDVVTIDGVDLCDDADGCVNPPYTLYRIILDDDGTPIRTPLANNIRSIELEYFSNASASTALAVADAGGGRWDPANPTASQGPRAIRSQIRAINMVLIGMNEAPDGTYTNPAETLAVAQNFRTYRLESLIVPRNIGKRGLAEQQTAPPGVPTLDAVEYGYCGVVLVKWTAPPASPSTGYPEGYAILYDTDATNTATQPLNQIHVPSTSNSTIYPVSTDLDPTETYRFTIAAVNSYGTTFSDMFVLSVPALNRTTPEEPTAVVATGGTAGTELDNAIEVSWTLPTDNVAGENQTIEKTPAGATALLTPGIHPLEIGGIEVRRSTDIAFDPDTPGPANVLAGIAAGAATSFIDATAAPCMQYYYKVRVVEPCRDDANKNDPATVSGYSEWSSPAAAGMANATGIPAAPTALTVVVADSAVGALTYDVMLEWNEVIADPDGNPVGVDLYEINLVQSGTPVGTPILVEPLSANAEYSSGKVRYLVEGLDRWAELNVTEHEYEFTVNALWNCTSQIRSAESAAVTFPVCNFAAGATLDVSIPEATSVGSGSTPWEVDGPATVVVSTSTGADMASVSAVAYDAASTFLAIGALTTTDTLPSSSVAFAWPGTGEDGSEYRVDISATDTAGCTSITSVYITETAVPCAFLTLTSSNFTVQQRSGGSPNTVSFVLSNALLDRDVEIDEIDLTWDESISEDGAGASTQNFQATVTGVRFPAVNGTATADVDPDNGGGTFTVAAPGAAIDVVQGATNYTVTLVMGPNNRNISTENPITSITIRYTILATTNAPAVDGECTIYP